MARIAEHLEERQSVIAVHDLVAGALAHAPDRHGLEEIHTSRGKHVTGALMIASPSTSGDSSLDRHTS